MLPEIPVPGVFWEKKNNLSYSPVVPSPQSQNLPGLSELLVSMLRGMSGVTAVQRPWPVRLSVSFWTILLSRMDFVDDLSPAPTYSPVQGIRLTACH